MADRRVSRPRHGVQDFPTFALQHVIHSEDPAGLYDPASFRLHLVFIGDIHRDVDCHRRIELLVGERQVRGVPLLE